MDGAFLFPKRATPPSLLLDVVVFAPPRDAFSVWSGEIRAGAYFTRLIILLVV